MEVSGKYTVSAVAPWRYLPAVAAVVERRYLDVSVMALICRLGVEVAEVAGTTKSSAFVSHPVPAPPSPLGCSFPSVVLGAPLTYLVPSRQLPQLPVISPCKCKRRCDLLWLGPYNSSFTSPSLLSQLVGCCHTPPLCRPIDSH